MKSILVIDDDEQYRKLLTKKLETEGFSVVTAASGQAALDYLKRESVDLLLLDLLMPNMNGIEFYYQLKKTLNKVIPTIILTNLEEGLNDPEIKAFLIKANTPLSVVVATIHRVLDVDNKVLKTA